MTLKELNVDREPSKSWAHQYLGPMTTMDPYLFNAGAGSFLSNSTVEASPRCKLDPATTPVNPSMRRLWFSRSASASPIKPKLSPKRVSVSALTSPCKTARRTRYPLSDLLPNESPGKRVRPRTTSRAKRSGRTNLNTTNNPDTLLSTVDLGADEGAEFQACDLCQRLCQQSLDAWMDHLGEHHPIPARWPSERADSLTDEQKQSPYSAVVGSHKRRRPHITPRPLNSFMIFAQYLRRATLQLFPDAHNVHLSQRIGLIWRQLDSELREQYATEASRLQRLHAIEFPDYKYQPKKRTREADPELVPPVSGTQPILGARTISAPAELISSVVPLSTLPAGSSTEWEELNGYDSPDGPAVFDSQVNGSNGPPKVSRTLSTTAQLVNVVRPCVAYVLHPSSLSSEKTNVSSYIPSTALLCMTDTDYVTSYAPESFDSPRTDLSSSVVTTTGPGVMDLPVVHETLTALVSENQSKVDLESVHRRSSSSSFLGVLHSPVETGSQCGSEWTQDRLSRPKALEDLLNAPSLFQHESGHLRTLQLEPLTVVTHVSPVLAPLDSSDMLGQDHLKREEPGTTLIGDLNRVPGSFITTTTPSLSTLSPDSSLGQQDSLPVVCWDAPKRSDSRSASSSVSAPAVVVVSSRPRSNTCSATSKVNARPLQYCPNITWNNSEAMYALGDIAMLIERGLHESHSSTSELSQSKAVRGVDTIAPSDGIREGGTEFADIDTCGTSPSLDDLGRLLLFSGTQQYSDSGPQSDVVLKPEEFDDQTVDDLRVPNPPEKSSLPSISSWTFGGSLSR